MHKSHHGNSRIRKMITVLSALAVSSGMSTPAFCAPADNNPTFRNAAGQAATSQTPPLADDTLLVLLKPHSDVGKVSDYLHNESNLQVVKNLHVSKDDYSILQVKPQAGQSEASFNKVGQMISTHPELATVTRNYLAHRVAAYRLDHMPNDPDFSQQWPLPAQRWPAARAHFGHTFVEQHNPNFTILADGCDPVATNNELGFFIQQFNAETPGDVFSEPVQGSFATGGGEGDVDSSISGCLTDNSTLIAGSDSFGANFPVNLTMLRMTTTDTVPIATIYGAITWAIENQATRGGHGPVNLGYGYMFPATPLWSDPNIQTLAGSLLNQGDALVVPTGDTAGLYVGFPPGNVIVVQGSDENNNLDVALNLLQGDPIAAPGSTQPAVIGGTFHDDYFGTSFSCAWVSSLIAMMLAVNPSLTSAQAYTVILRTGQHIHATSAEKHLSYPVVIPAWDYAIDEAGHRFLN